MDATNAAKSSEPLSNSPGFNGGYVNGGYESDDDEKFEPALEEPVFEGLDDGEKVIHGGDDNGVSFVDSSEFSMPAAAERESVSVDDDDEFVGKVRVLKEQAIGGGDDEDTLQENGDEVIINKVESGDVSSGEKDDSGSKGEFETGKPDKEVTETELNGGEVVEGEKSDALEENGGESSIFEVKDELNSNGKASLDEFEGEKLDKEVIETESNGGAVVESEKGDALQENGGEASINKLESGVADFEGKVELNSNGRERLDEFEGKKLDKEVTEIESNDETGVVEEKSEVYGDVQPVEAKESADTGLVVEDASGSGIAAGEEGSVIEEIAGDKVEVDGVDSSAKEDLVIDTPRDLSVADIEEPKKSETQEVVGDVSLVNGFDHENVKVHSNVEGDREVDHLASNDAANTNVETNEQLVDVDAEEKGNSDSTDYVVNGVPENELNDKQFEIADELVRKENPVTESVSNVLKEEAFVFPRKFSDDKDREDSGDVTLEANLDTETTQTTAAHESAAFDNDSPDVKVLDRELELDESIPPESAELSKASNTEIDFESEDEEGETEGSTTDGEDEGMMFDSSEAAKQFLEELEERSSAGSRSLPESSHALSQRIDGQVETDSDEEADSDGEGEEKELFDHAALAALLKAATGADSDGSGITISSQDGSRLFSVERPAGLGSSLRNLKPAARSTRPNLFNPAGNLVPGSGRVEPEVNLSEEEKKKLEKLQQIRVKFLRLVQRLGHSLEDPIVAQVLYRLALVAGKQNTEMFSLDSAKSTAQRLELLGQDDLNFSLNILVLGKTGVGKSATINSIFREEKASINAFETSTTAVKEVNGVVDGVKIRVYDSPGLKSSAVEQRDNSKVLGSIKRFTKRSPPDIVLYVDRLDTQTRDLNDLPLLKSISSSLGSSIWRNAIVTLTHAASAPPDGPSGSPLSYEVFVGQRSHIVQQSIGHAVGDLRLMNPSLMNPVSLVENHPSCRRNRDGHKVLPNGQSWRPQLLLLCYSMKILSEASALSKPQEPIDHKKLFGFRVRSPPLPYLLSWLLQSRTHPKLATDQDNGDSDIDMADLSDSDDEEDDDEYEQLPPFKPLKKEQLAKLSNEHRKMYLEEYDYRVKLLQKKQWRDEVRRMKEMKKRGKPAAVGEEIGEAGSEEDGGPASVPVPLPDMVLPPSFDADSPAYRYRFLEPTSQFLARPVLDTHGWDHDCGYDGVNVEQSLAIANKFPTAIALQVTKDKKDFSIHLDSSVSAKHGENGSTMAGFDIQNVGKQLAYIIRGETKMKTFRKNKTAAGFSVTFLGENIATGFKLEDQLALGNRLVLVGSTGTVKSQGDSAYGANLEVRLREADFPIGQDQSSLGLSLVKWRGDLALGANLQSQFAIGRGSKVSIRAGLNNKMSGQITVRTTSSDQLQIALLALLPIAKTIYKNIRPGVPDNNYMY